MMNKTISIIVSIIFILFICSKNKKDVLMNDYGYFWSPDLMTVGTYDSLVKMKGNPKNETIVKLPRQKRVNGEWVTCQKDTVAFIFYSDGVSYFRYYDSVQLRTVDFYKIQTEINFNNEKYNAKYSLKEFIRRHNVDEEAIQRVSGLLYGNDKRDGYCITLNTNDIFYNSMDVFFNADGHLRYVNFGVYNGGILR